MARFGRVCLAMVTGLFFVPADPVASSFAQAATTPGAQPIEAANIAEWRKAVEMQIRRRAGSIMRKAAKEGRSGRYSARVRFTVSPKGEISDVRLDQSSGDARLDEIARNTFAAGAPLQPFSPDMDESKPQAVVAPLEFFFPEPPATPEAPQTS